MNEYKVTLSDCKNENKKEYNVNANSDSHAIIKAQSMSVVEGTPMIRIVDVSRVLSNMDKIVLDLDKHIIPYKYNSADISNLNYDTDYRGQVIKRQGFTLLASEWIDLFSKWIGTRSCLEIMAGTGSLSKELKDRNINIVATDNYSWSGRNNWNEKYNYWIDVENLDCIDAINKYSSADIIIISWPYMDKMAYSCLLAIRKINPDCLMVYIGEDEGGCTASEEFFHALNGVKDDEFYSINDVFPSWWGIHDQLYLIK